MLGLRRRGAQGMPLSHARGAVQGPWSKVWARLAPSSHCLFFFLEWENLILTFHFQFQGVSHSWKHRAVSTPVFGLTAKNEAPLFLASEMDPSIKEHLLSSAICGHKKRPSFLRYFRFLFQTSNMLDHEEIHRHMPDDMIENKVLIILKYLYVSFLHISRKMPTN